MMKSFLIKYRLFILISVPALLILWKLILFIDLPYPNLDGPWQLSHTFSILSGQFFLSSFAYDFWIPFQFPPLYGILSSLYFMILHPISKIYSIFFYNIVLIFSAVILSNIFLDKKKIHSYSFKLIIFLSLITTTDIYNQRLELLNINILLILIIILDSQKPSLTNLNIFLTSLITAAAGLVHPVGGFFAVCLCTFIAFTKRFELMFFIKYYLILLLILIISYVPIIMLDYNVWYRNFFTFYLSSEGEDPHKFYYLRIFKYFIISPSSFLPYIYLLFPGNFRFKTILKEFLILTAFLFLISLFGRYYYFPYIYIFIIWRISTYYKEELKLNYYAAVFLLIISPLSTHYIPSISQFLNRSYAENFRNVINYVNEKNYFADYQKVFISTPISMPLIEYQNSRLLVGEYPTYLKFNFNKNELALLANPELIEIFKMYYKLDSSNITITEIFKPVKEDYPIYFRSKYEDKRFPVGLYEIKLK